MTAQIGMTCKYCDSKGWMSAELSWDHSESQRQIANMIEMFSEDCECRETEVLISILRKAENWTSYEKSMITQLLRGRIIRIFDTQYLAKLKCKEELPFSDITIAYYKKKRSEIVEILSKINEKWAKRIVELESGKFRDF